jgi:predicted amidohydrolase
MSRRFLMACVQLNSNNQLDANLERTRHWIRRAAERNVELILLPEDFAFLAANELEKQALSDADLQRIREAVREEAIRHNLHIVAGGHPVRDGETGKFFNTATLFSPSGEELAQYQKIHLFDADPPGATPIRESDLYSAGQQVCVADTSLGRIGLSICYDLRFPEMYRQLALAGADILAVPAAFTLTTGKDHWQILLQARAIENQCYVAAPAQWGRHNERRHSFGRSLVCDPWGMVVACASEGEGLAVGEFVPDQLAHVRGIVPCRQHIRRDLFPLTHGTKGEA